MAYARPAVTVIQEFIGLVPALATFALPSVAVGAVYQLVDDDLLGTYDGDEQSYAYAELMAGAEVDLEELADDEAFPATKKPVSVKIVEATIEILPTTTSGAANGQAFSDLTGTPFEDALVGDFIVIVESLAVAIISPQTDGVTSATAGQRNRLTAGTVGQFANVKEGDTVTVTGGTNTNTGTFEVIARPSTSLIVVDSDINDGVGASTDVAYSIAGDRGTNNQGRHKIKVRTDDNNVILETSLPDVEAPLTYSVERDIDEIILERVTLPDNGFEPTDSTIDLPAGLQLAVDANNFDIIAGNVTASYRALRNDKAASVVEYGRLSDVQAAFGTDQITPQNPLAFALSIMLQNTITPVNGLGLDENAVTDEVLSFQAALDVLAMTEMYALVPLTQNPAIHQLFKTHVEQLSQPAEKKERVAIVNRLLVTVETVTDEATTSVAEAGARIIVNTQVDGSALFASPTVLNDATTDQFLNVMLGDSVVIVAGTNAVAGTFTVLTKNSNNQLTLSGSIVTANSTDLQYYIWRRDGLEANGTTFYDRNATFITSGVAAGMYVSISSPSTPAQVPGRHKIASVTSEKELEIEQVAGVTTLVGTIVYEVERDLTKTEQAAFIEGYSSSLNSRRVVNTWPDVLNTPVGQEVEPLPGFYGGCSIGAITTGLPTQQGFTNLTVSGFLGLEHSTKYFTDTQLDSIANGGTLIFIQEVAEAPLLIRHQLTTDRSAIKFQEFSVTKNVDFISKFIRDQYAHFIGVYNIIDTTKDELRTNATATIKFLRDDTKLPRIGGVVRSGILKLLEEDATQIDKIRMRFKFDIPIPLNNLEITVEV